MHYFAVLFVSVDQLLMLLLIGRSLVIGLLLRIFCVCGPPQKLNRQPNGLGIPLLTDSGVKLPACVVAAVVGAG
jgi:hypothetical protein